jgi:hypothetical protein
LILTHYLIERNFLADETPQRVDESGEDDGLGRVDVPVDLVSGSREVENGFSLINVDRDRQVDLRPVVHVVGRVQLALAGRRQRLPADLLQHFADCDFSVVLEIRRRVCDSNF